MDHLSENSRNENSDTFLCLNEYKWEILIEILIDNVYQKNQGSVVFLSRFEVVGDDDIEHVVYIPIVQEP